MSVNSVINFGNNSFHKSTTYSSGKDKKTRFSLKKLIPSFAVAAGIASSIVPLKVSAQNYSPCKYDKTSVYRLYNPENETPLTFPDSTPGSVVHSFVTTVEKAPRDSKYTGSAFIDGYSLHIYDDGSVLALNDVTHEPDVINLEKKEKTIYRVKTDKEASEEKGFSSTQDYLKYSIQNLPSPASNNNNSVFNEAVKNGYFVKQINYNPGSYSTEIFSPDGKRSSGISHISNSDSSVTVSSYKYTPKGDKIYQNITVFKDGKPISFPCREEINLQNASFDYDVQLNGKIEAADQNFTGDCWLLTAVNALSYSPEGRNILDKAVSYTPDGAILHTILGDYSISYDEIQNAKTEVVVDKSTSYSGFKYSVGDDDMKIFELGFEKLRQDIVDGNIKFSQGDYLDNYRFKNDVIVPDDTNVLSGGWPGQVVYLLTGNKSSLYFSQDEKNNILNKFKNNSQPSVLSCSFTDDSSIVDCITGETVNLYSKHSYAVKSAYNNFIILTNPQKPDIDINITKENVLNLTNLFEYTDISRK